MAEEIPTGFPGQSETYRAGFVALIGAPMRGNQP